MNQRAELLLNQCHSDPMEALEMACDYIIQLENNCVSSGFVRAKPGQYVKPAKPRVVPLTAAGPHPGQAVEAG